MHRAAKKGHLGTVRHLIDMGVSVDSRDHLGRTPLHLAVEHGHYQVAELLIHSKCDLNLRENVDGHTPVMCAAASWRRDMVYLLLRHGAQMHCPNYDNYCLLHHAASFGWLEITRVILESGATAVDVTSTKWGDTPLIGAARCGRTSALALLIRAGADVSRRDARQWTALHWAAHNGYPETVQQLLLVEGIDPSPRAEDGQTPLHKACRRRAKGLVFEVFGEGVNRYLEIIEQLVAVGVDTNIKDNRGKTALGVGLRSKNILPEGIRLLVRNGAYLEEIDYALLPQSEFLQENDQRNADFYTQSVVNRYHCHSLTTLKSDPYFGEKIPLIDNLKLSDGNIDDIENFIKWNIQAGAFPNIAQARSMVLSVLCVEALLAYKARME